MTIADCNKVIGQFLEKQGLIKIKSGKTWDLTSNKELQTIFGVKTSSTIDFSNNILALNYLTQKVSSIKEVCLNINFFGGEVGVGITIGGTINENTGNLERCTFSCERTKPLNRVNSALFEVLSTFCGWTMKNTSFRSDIHYELARVSNGNDNYGANTQLIEPIEVKCLCPKCKEEIQIMFNDLKPLPIEDLK